MGSRVTQQVRDRIDDAFFTDIHFMTVLDVAFANLYFDAVRASVENPGHISRAWAPLIQARARPGIAAIQYAVAGMNAHINHDLPVAVVTTCQMLGTAPSTRPHHDDFTRVNPVLDAVEQTVRQSFEHGVVLAADHVLASPATVVGNWSIAEARGAAWINAEVLWRLRRTTAIRRAFLDTLAGSVGLASRGLLVRLG